MNENNYKTLSQAINGLIQSGYNEDFKAEKYEIVRQSDSKGFRPSELSIVNHFRFEGMSNPQDDTVVFALEATDGTKGNLVMSHSAEHNQNVELIKQIPEKG
jgi:hypothetical protein